MATGFFSCSYMLIYKSSAPEKQGNSRFPIYDCWRFGRGASEGWCLDFPGTINSYGLQVAYIRNSYFGVPSFLIRRSSVPTSALGDRQGLLFPDIMIDTPIAAPAFLGARWRAPLADSCRP